MVLLQGSSYTDYMKKEAGPTEKIMREIERLDTFSEFLQVLEQYPGEKIEINPHAYSIVGKMMEESIVKIVAILQDCKIKWKKDSVILQRLC